jgi:hypothetical protein
MRREYSRPSPGTVFVGTKTGVARERSDGISMRTASAWHRLWVQPDGRRSQWRGFGKVAKMTTNDEGYRPLPRGVDGMSKARCFRESG